MKGKYIVVEGYDGSGKSLLAQRLGQRLREDGDRSHVRGFPSETGDIGAFIRTSFRGDVKFDRKAYLPLMIADAIDHEATISAYVEQGFFFIADRHATFSAFVYQTEDLSESTVEAMFSALPWRKPDLAILVDAPVDVAMRRQRSRRGKPADIVFEKNDVEYNTRLREKYLALFHRYDGAHVILDGQLDSDLVLRDALAALRQLTT